MDDLAEHITRVEERAKSNTHRLDKLEKLADEIHELGINIASMCEQLRQQGESLKKQDARLERLEAKPVKRWEAVANKVISAGVGALLAYAVIALTLPTPL